MTRRQLLDILTFKHPPAPGPAAQAFDELHEAWSAFVCECLKSFKITRLLAWLAKRMGA